MKKAVVVASMMSVFPMNEPIYFGVDRGALYLAQVGIFMEEAIGDFDSVNEEEMNLIRQFSKKIHHLNAIKDETDLEVALKRVVDNSYDEIVVYGALGGRIDHMYANIMLVNRYSNQANITLFDDNHEIRIITKANEYLFTKNGFKYHSFFAIENSAISLIGFKYELDNYKLRTKDIRCVSNEILSNSAKLVLHKGRLLYIGSNDVI